MTLGCGLPMGPLALLDLIGLDTAQQILETMYEQSRDRRHAPAPLLRQLVAAGLLGRKTGRGFYTYASPGSGEIVPDPGLPAPGLREPAGERGRQVRRVGVAGCGSAARDLAGLLAGAGYDVVLAEGRDVADADRGATLDGVRVTSALEDLADADLVVESADDDPAAGRALLENLDKICKPGAVLATTGWGPVVQAAAGTSRPADVVGLHVVAPAYNGETGTRLVEVVQSVMTAPDALATALAVCERLAVTAVRCADRAGFIVGALLFPYLNDAVRMVSEQYASADDIDTAMKAGCGYPVGPFELLDAVGPRVALTALRSLYEEAREPGYAPAPLLVQLVTVGRGFRTERPVQRPV
jgi:3-hydroxybutyryl-CoA dehydrogenase